MATQVVTENKFLGINLHDHPEDLQPGQFVQIDNLLREGAKLKLRPGRLGLFTFPLSAPPYAMTEFVDVAMNQWILFTAGGKLYKTQRNSASYQEIMISGSSFNLDSPNTQIVRAGKYAYVVDGTVGGPVYQIDLFNATALGTIVTPGAPGTPTLTRNIITTFPDYGHALALAHSNGIYTYLGEFNGLNTGTPVELVNNGDFEQVTSNGYGPSGWNFFFKNPRISPGQGGAISGYGGGNCMQMDNDYGTKGLSQNTFQMAGPTTNPYFTFSMYGNNTNRGSQSCQFTITAIDASSNPIAGFSVSSQFTFTSNSGWSRQTIEFNIPLNLLPQVSAFSISLINPSTYTGQDTLYIDKVSLKQSQFGLTPTYVDGKWKFTGYGNHITGNNPYIFPQLFGTVVSGITVPPLPNFNDPLTSGNIINLDFTWGITGPKPNIRLGIQTVTNGVYYMSAPMSYSADGTYAYVDISPILNQIGPSNFTAITAFSLMVDDDLDPAASLGVNGWAFTVGSAYFAGNLSVTGATPAVPYYYYYSEVSPFATPSTSSSESPHSPSVKPTDQYAVAKVTLNQPANSGTTYYNIYRYGGVLVQTSGKLLATVAVSSASPHVDTASQQMMGTFPGVTGGINPYIKWDETTKSLVDNTPDSWLLAYSTDAPLNAQPPPLGGQRLCFWQDRLWISVNESIYGSWLIDETQATQLNFTSLEDLGDAQIAIKGYRSTVGSNDNDNVVCMVPYGSSMLIFKRRGVYMLNGYDPTNFKIISFLLHREIGCIAPNAAIMFDNKVWFLGPSGVYVFSQNTTDAVSVMIDNGIGDTSNFLSNALISRSFMVSHGKQIYLMTPSNDDSIITHGWVWDNRYQVWTHLTNMPVTSGISFGSTDDNSQLYFGGYIPNTTSGQLSIMSNCGDTDAIGSPNPIPWALTTRVFGKEGGDGMFSRKQALKVRVNMASTSPTPIQLSIIGDNNAVVFGPKTLNTKNLWSFPVSIAANARGQGLQMKLTGANTSYTFIDAISLTYSEGTSIYDSG